MPDTREGHAEIRARGVAFLRWLLVRPRLPRRHHGHGRRIPAPSPFLLSKEPEYESGM